MEKFIGFEIVSAEPETKYFQGDGAEGSAGWRVSRPDGSVSWWPVTEFGAAYRKASAMSFGLAIEALKKGERVTRAKWNGKGMWLVAIRAQDWQCDVDAIPEEDADIELCGFFALKTSDGEFVPWMVSQSDMQADDWMIVE